MRGEAVELLLETWLERDKGKERPETKLETRSSDKGAKRPSIRQYGCKVWRRYRI